MPIYAIQFLLALPLFLFNIGWLFWALRNPLRIGLIGLSFFSFCMQFIIGIVLFPLGSTLSGYINTGDVVLAFVSIYAFWLGVALIGLLWKTRLEYVEVGQEEGTGIGRGIFANLINFSLGINIATLIGFYGLSLFVRFWVLIKYGFGFSGTFIALARTLPYFALSVWIIFNTLGLSFIFICATHFLYNRPGKLWSGIILLIELFWTFTQGRRPMFGAILLIMFALVAKWGKVKFRHVLSGIVLAILSWQFVFPFFFFMRQEWVSGERFLPRMIATATAKSVTDRDTYTSGIQRRLHALHLNYLIAHQLRSGTPKFNGGFLKMAVLTAIPSVIFPQKSLYARGADNVLNERFALGFEGRDFATDIGVFALADFGWMGGFIYGALFVALIRFVEKIIKLLSHKTPIGAAACFSVIASCPVLNMETTTDYLIVYLRTILILFLSFFAWGYFFGSKEVPVIDEETADEQWGHDLA